MQWDIFCEVIDNYGDVGVCWRLSRDLAGRGHKVRLWLNDSHALAWMAPQLRPTAAPGLGAGPLALFTSQDGAITVHDWSVAGHAPAASLSEVVIEAFGCRPPEAFLRGMAEHAAAGAAPVWVNLEYLSAQDYVERSHGLRSPVCDGPAAGLSKWFYYPGFTTATGGLLREPGLTQARDDFRLRDQAAWLQRLGLACQAQDRLVSLFCYAQAPVSALLEQLTQHAQALWQDQGAQVWVLTTPGHATALAQRWQAQSQAARGGRQAGHPGLRFHALAHLSQCDFDRLLWACDLNLVRGEDSAVRALWAARPHLWQLYPQDDGAQLDKWHAFAQKWMHQWPTPVHDCLWQWGLFLNGGRESAPEQPLPDWWSPEAAWRQASAWASTQLAAQRDLVTQLTEFVASKR